MVEKKLMLKKILIEIKEKNKKQNKKKTTIYIYI